MDLNRFDLSQDAGAMRIYLQKSDIWRHIEYNPDTRENDMALVFLPVGVDLETIELNDNDDIPEAAGDLLKVSGWGRTSADGYSPLLPHTTTVGYLSNSDCNSPGLEVTDDMMCATSLTEEAKGPCTYDSVSRLYIVHGIVTHTHPTLSH